MSAGSDCAVKPADSSLGFTFYQGMDHIYDDINCQYTGNSVSSWSSLLSTCQNTPGCLAVNQFWRDGGYNYCLKSKGSSLMTYSNIMSEACLGIYVKQGTYIYVIIMWFCFDNFVITSSIAFIHSHLCKNTLFKLSTGMTNLNSTSESPL
jgi:hypothetical protein